MAKKIGLIRSEKKRAKRICQNPKWRRKSLASQICSKQMPWTGHFLINSINIGKTVNTLKRGPHWR
jgi:hypothetical protein